MDWEGPIRQRNLDVAEGLYREFKATAGRRGIPLYAALTQALEGFVGLEQPGPEQDQDRAVDVRRNPMVEYILHLLETPEEELDQTFEAPFQRMAQAIFDIHVEKEELRSGRKQGRKKNA